MQSKRAHAIVQELKRVAGEKGRTPTRDEFYADASITTTQWSMRDVFGTFEVAVRAAGLDPARKKTDKDPKVKLEKEVGKHQLEMRASERFKMEIMPWVGKYEKKHPKLMRIAAASDFHSYWTDPFAFHVYRETCKRIKPDVIALVGDLFDFYQLSKYSKDPTRILNTQDEVDYICDKIFAPLRKENPDSQIDFFIGNHEWRLFRYLCEQAPALAGLRDLQFDKLFKLEKYGINLVARPSLLAAKKAKDFENHKIYGGCYALVHGPSTATQHAKKCLDKYKCSGASGHMHNYQVASTTDLHGERTWTSMGCMCKDEDGHEFIDDFIPWQKGFEIAHIDATTKTVLKEYVQVQNGQAMVGGIHFSDRQARSKIEL